MQFFLSTINTTVLKLGSKKKFHEGVQLHWDEHRLYCITQVVEESSPEETSLTTVAIIRRSE